jgi:hypothetical protein
MERKQNIDAMYRKIATEIEISETQAEKAKESYEAVGNYLNNNIKQYDVRIFPQGSFMLGTVIKPISDKDEYDIDLVATIDNKFTSAKDLKNIVGDVLKTSDRYSEKVEEGKRCWTIQYSESANYHMDILPTMKSDTYFQNKKLIMTHKEDENSDYEFRQTNPEAYYDWFVKRMEEEKKKLTEEYAIRNKIEIVEVPEYKIKTTLQIAIEILKRYRDIKFKDTPDIKPISIILTTLMARIYTGKENVYELIEKFSKEYVLYLEKDENGNVLIQNPVNENENFADKWPSNPERKEAFFKFMDDLKYDLVTNKVLLEGNIREQADAYKKLFGENMVNKVYENIAQKTREEREKSNMYLKENGNLTTEKTNITVRNHNFYGK